MEMSKFHVRTGLGASTRERSLYQGGMNYDEYRGNDRAARCWRPGLLNRNSLRSQGSRFRCDKCLADVMSLVLESRLTPVTTDECILAESKSGQLIRHKGADARPCSPHQNTF